MNGLLTSGPASPSALSNELRLISPGNVGERAELGAEGVESEPVGADLDRLGGRNVSNPSGAASMATRCIVGIVFRTNCDLVIF
jgi:hypothetical protein